MLNDQLLPAPELRFHVNRLGTRRKVAIMLGVRETLIYESLPTIQFDHYRRGMAVNIGGIQAKKCLSCGVARELEHFWSSNNKSGCRPVCSYCRSAK